MRPLHGPALPDSKVHAAYCCMDLAMRKRRSGSRVNAIGAGLGWAPRRRAGRSARQPGPAALARSGQKKTRGGLFPHRAVRSLSAQLRSSMTSAMDPPLAALPVLGSCPSRAALPRGEVLRQACAKRLGVGCLAVDLHEARSRCKSAQQAEPVALGLPGRIGLATEVGVHGLRGDLFLRNRGAGGLSASLPICLATLSKRLRMSVTSPRGRRSAMPISS